MIVIQLLLTGLFAFLGYRFILPHLLNFTDWSVGQLNQVLTICPACHQQIGLPAYECPGCKTLHSNLKSAKGQVLRKLCGCGAKLWTSYVLGRSKYAAKCPRCSRRIEDAERIPICLPLVGTPDAGKTCFLYAFSDLFIEKTASHFRWKASPAEKETEIALHRIRVEAKAGRYPNKTVALTAQAYQIKFANSRGLERILHIYDTAGEVFTGGKALSGHHFYGYCHGYILLLDTNALVKAAESGASLPNDPEDAFTRLLNHLEEDYGIGKTEVFQRPLAVVLNKVDQSEIRSYWEGRGVNVDQPRKITSRECEKLLRDCKYGNFVSMLRSRFTRRRLRFFAASALRPKVEGSGGELVPRGVEPIIAWLLANASLGLSGTVLIAKKGKG